MKRLGLLLLLFSAPVLAGEGLRMGDPYFASPQSSPFIPAAANLPVCSTAPCITNGDYSYPDPAYPSTIQTVILVSDTGGDYPGTATGLHNAITYAVANRATLGNTGAIEIKVDPAGTYTSATSYDFNSCGGATTELILRTSKTTMPAQGTRITAANYADMPVIETTGLDTVRVIRIGYPSVNGTVQACRIRLMGLKIQKASGAKGNYLVQIGDGVSGTVQDTSAEVPYRIWVDRSYIGQADATQNSYNAVVMQAKYSGLVDSICRVSSNTFSDGECFSSENTPGNLLIANNDLQASGESIGFGGSGNVTTGDQYIVSDITIRRNVLSMPTSCPATAICKNLVEFKNGVRFLLEGNIMQHSVVDGQNGEAITIKAGNSGGNRPWVETAHGTVRYNIARDLEGFFIYFEALIATAYGNKYVHHMSVHDNLADGASNGFTATGPAGWMSNKLCTAATGCPALADRVTSNLYQNHNTIIASARVHASIAGGWTTQTAEVLAPLDRCTGSFALHASIVPLTREGATSASSSTGSCKVDGIRIDAQKWSHDYNSFVDNWLTNATAAAITTPNLATKPMAQYALGRSADQCSLFVSCLAANIGTGANNYTLATPTPAFDAATRTAAGLSTNVGADIAKINTMTGCTLVGNWTACSGQPAPTVTSITPSSGSYLGGTAITNLAGTGFIAGAPSSTATFGGVAGVNCVVVSSIKITCDTPAHAAGAVDVVVTNPDLQSGTLAAGFTYTGSGAATITSVCTSSCTSPAPASFAGGAPLKIIGTNFAQGATVLVGGQSCSSVSVVGSTLIYCTTPSSDSLGTKDVSVTNPGDSPVTAAASFLYTNVLITGVTPP